LKNHLFVTYSAADDSRKKAKQTPVEKSKPSLSGLELRILIYFFKQRTFLGWTAPLELKQIVGKVSGLTRKILPHRLQKLQMQGFLEMKSADIGKAKCYRLTDAALRALEIANHIR
jgi:DNA-binding HxlR family transcriptional regulator